MGESRFELLKRDARDLQSAPFGHSGTLPYAIGAGGRTRTPDLLITNQLLYQLSYTSTLYGFGFILRNQLYYYSTLPTKCQVFFRIF